MYDITSTGILHNTETGRYHPILFRAAPSYSFPERQRSRGHHTEGFDTLEAAIAYLAEKEYPDPQAMWDWDGVGVPAMTI